MRIIRLNRDILLLTLLTSIASAAITGPAAGQNADLPDVLNLAPADAPVIMVVPSLSGLSQKIAKLNEESLGSSVPYMFDVLSMLKGMMGMGAGLNDDGSLMLVMTSAEMDANPPMVMVAPVLDYAAFVGNFGGNAADPIATLTLPHGAPGFVKQIDQYAIFSDSQENVENFQPGHAIDAIATNVGTAGKRCLTNGDLLVIFDIAALAPAIEPALQEMRNSMDEVSGQMAQLSQGPPPPGTEMLPIMMTLYMNAIDALARDTSAVVVGLDISSQGVGLASSAQFKPDSHLATIFTNGGGGAQQLNRIPNQPYWIASGIDLRGIATATLAQDLIDAFEGQDQSPEQDTFKMGQLIQEAATLVKQTTAMATVYYQPAEPVMMGGNFLNGVAVYETTDAPAYTQAVQEYFQTMNDFFAQVNDLAQQAADQVAPEEPIDGHDTHGPQQQMTIISQYTPNALQVNGTAVDEYEIKYTFPQEMMQDMGPAGPMMMMMMGGAGQSGYVTTKGNFVVMTTTRDQQVLQQALDALDQNAGLGADAAINQVRQAGVLPNSSMESYISIPGMMQSVNMFMGMWGMQPIQVPADLPPIASSLNVEDHGIATRLHIPTKVIEFCYSATGQAMMMMGGGPQPQGGQQDQQPQHRDPFTAPPAPR